MVLVALLLPFSHIAHAQDGTVATDKAALEALYDATDGANWTTSTNWKTEEALNSWHGVTTDTDGRVTDLDLGGNGLDGTLAAALGDLDALETLDLSSNELSGSLPTGFTELTALTSLTLTRSRALSGSLPDGLRELANLATVEIGSTELCAPEDGTFQAWVASISFTGLRCPPATQSTIDLAVFYTPAARAAEGSATAMEDEIDRLVVWTNDAYRSSGVNQRVSLVAVEETPYEQVDFFTDLNRLDGAFDGHMDEVHAVRSREGADIVMLIRASDSFTIGGVARLMTIVSPSFAASAFGASTASARNFAHELGHIMGLNHDRYEACTGSRCNGAAFPYAYGYIHCDETSYTDRWRTIMAYADKCTSFRTAALFSNPERTYRGDPLGEAGLAPSTSRTEGPADAVRALNRTRAYVSEFRQAPNITVSFGTGSYTATEGGSGAVVTVELSEAPTRPIEVPLMGMPGTGATAYDYSGVPSFVRFGTNDTAQTFTVTAVNDAADEDNETLLLTLGQPPARNVTLGSPSQTTVNLVDNDPPATGAPSLLTVELTSETGPEGSYAIGDDLEASVRFNKYVSVTGEPRLALTVGSDPKQATYRSTSGEVVRFVYTVAEDDVDENGVSIAANSLTLNGGMIRDGDDQDASLTHSAVASDADHPVDGVRPTLETAEAHLTELILTFDKALESTSIPPTSAFGVTVDGSPRSVTDVAVRDRVVTLTLSGSIPYNEDGVKVNYTPGTPTLQDTIGNPAAAFSDEAVTADPPPYDTDTDGLIEIANVTQLDAMRHDMDGNGEPTMSGATAYATAFPEATSALRCAGGCDGYELSGDLDFKAEGKWTSGDGWQPIGEILAPFDTTFDGNGHTVSNLFVNRRYTSRIRGIPALFGAMSALGVIRNVGLVNVNIRSSTLASGAALVGSNSGTVRACYATGQVQAGYPGGLVASNQGTISASYAAVRVIGQHSNTRAGGLVAANYGSSAEIIASHASGWTSGTATSNRIGGLVGENSSGTISASYATGRVTGGTVPGGLVGSNSGGTITASYWGTETSGLATSTGGTAKATDDLQSPTGYSGIYSGWNVNVDGTGGADSAWHFGTTAQYPALKADSGDGTWTSFGYQLRAGPALTAVSESGRAKLTWTAVDVSAWDPMPTVTYTVIRDDGTSVTALASGLDVLTYTDSGVTIGSTYTYQVAAYVGGGAAARSAVEEVTVISTDSTAPTIESIASGTTHPTKDPFTVTITFTESVTDLMADEITVTNGTGSNFSGSGSTYTLRVTPNADFEGNVTVSVAANAAKDSAQNLSEAGSATFAVDTIVPTLATSGGATVNGSTLTLTFNEALGAANVPTSAFTVTGATSRSISAVSVVGATVSLTLSVPVLNGETGVEVDYDPPSSNAIVDEAGNKAAELTDQAVTNNTPATALSTTVRLTMNEAEVAEGGSAKTVTVTGTLDRAPRSSATTVTVAVGAGSDTAAEGTDYVTVDDLSLTIAAYSTSGTESFTLTPTNDRIDEVGESLTVTGSTAITGLSVTPPGGLALDIADNDAAPSLVLSVSASTIDEDGGTATVTVSTGSGSTFATDQTVRLAVAGTATETADYTISGKTLTLPAGVGTSASMVTATVTGMDDSLDDDNEAIEITGSRNSVAFGSRQTISVVDDDWPVLTVTFRQADYRVAEGGQVYLPITLSAVPERQVTVPIDIEGVDGAESVDYSVSPSALTFGASETDKTVRVSASNDSVVDPGESVALSFGTPFPERISEGGIAQTAVAIRDTDFTFAPVFAAGTGTTESDSDTYTVSEDTSALRLSLSLETPRRVRVVDIVDSVVVTLATRQNAGSRGMDEDYATQRRSGTFGDYGELNRDLSFAPGDFSDDTTCGCARAEKAVSVDLFNDRVHERVEVFGLRLSRKSGRLGVASKDITAKITEDDAEPVLTLQANPGSIAEAGGTSMVTVSTASGSTFPDAQTIRLDLSGTATQGPDYTIDSTALTLPAGVGQDPSSVTTTVRAQDDPIDDDGETVVLAASRDAVEFARRTVGIDDDETGSTQVDLSVNPAQVREDAGATTVRVAASLNADARGQDTEVTVTVGSSGDSAVEGTDYGTVGDLSLTIDAGATTAETTFSLDPANNDSVDGAKTITVDGSTPGLAVRSTDLTLNDDDVASTTVTLTLDPIEVSESAGSRTVRVTGTLDGTARMTETVVTVTVGSGADTALEGTDYVDIPELELTIPANRTDGTVTFNLRPTNDRTAEGKETISVSGDIAGLAVISAELALADDDSPSTRLDLSLNPSTVSESAVPTDVVVTGSLNAGARTSDSVVTVAVGVPTDSATEGVDYANVSALEITVPANETTGQTMFTLSPENDVIAEGAETISATGRVSGLTVETATLTLSDNDTASRVVTLSVDPQSVSEDMPEDVTVTASLNAGARAEDTEVRLTVGAAGDTAVPGTDYERVSEQTLTILAGETSGVAVFRLEPVNNDSTDGARTLSVRGSTTVAELRIEPAAGARIALEDDDSPAVLVVPDTLTVVEAESDIYTVELQTRPTADVTVMIGGVSGDLSLDKMSLVFTQADWRNPQDVEVTAADDDDSVQDSDVTLTHRASGAAEYRGLRSDLVVSIRENDPSLVFSDSSLTVREGETATYTVALATLPTADVTVRVTGVSGDLSLDRTQLMFTRGNWDNAQPVTVEAAEDDDTSTDPRVTLTHTATGGGYDGIVGELRVTVTEKDGGGGTGGGGGGGAANHPPVVEREIEDQTLDVGEVLELDIRLNFYDRDQRALDYTAESADPSVATAAVDRNGLVTIRGIKRGVTAITVTAADRRDERASDTFAVTVRGPAFVALFPRAADPALEGFARVINHDMEAGEVSIEAIDDTGARHGPITLSIEAGETVHFNSGDLEDGNAAKGLPVGMGSGEGDWRLVLSSELDFEALSYIRTQDGFLTAMHDTVPMREGTYRVAIFNPGDNPNQVSHLRLINPGGGTAEVTVEGIDDAGDSPGDAVTVDVPAGESVTLTASELESGTGLDGALGDGTGKWRLRVTATEPIVAMSLLSSPTGHLTNLSALPRTPDEDGAYVVPLFPAASDALGRQGFVQGSQPLRRVRHGIHRGVR